MALSITSRPAQWSAAKNPVVYKFETSGGPFVNYRIEVEVFDGDDNSLGPKFVFTPSADGVTICDVSSILKAHLKAEWIKPSSLNEAEEDTSLEYYIKYQELYDESETSVISDSGNHRNVVFGALQIPSSVGNNLDQYVTGDDTKKFLTVFSTPKIWRGYPATLSFIFPDASNLRSVALIRTAYGNTENITGAEELDLDNDESVNRINVDGAITLNENPFFKNTLYPWNPGVSNWTLHEGGGAEHAFTDGEASGNLNQNIGTQLDGLYDIEVKCRFTVEDVSGTLTLSVIAGPEITYHQQSVSGTSVTTITLLNESVGILGDFNALRIFLGNITSGIPGSFIIESFSFKKRYPEANRLSIQLSSKSLGDEILSNEGFLAAGDLVDPWMVIDSGADWSQSGGMDPNLARVTVELTGAVKTSDILYQDIPEQTAGLYAILIRASGPVATSNVTMNAYSNGLFVQELFNENVYTGDSSTFQDFEVTVEVSDAFDYIEVVASKDDAGTAVHAISTVSLRKEASAAHYSEELLMPIEDACQNPVMLFWKNSLGGDSWWLFDVDQEVNYSLSSNKAKRMRLFANNLTANEWEALNELNNLGEVYKENITELTSSVRRSHVRDGSQVYVVDTDGNKTGVIVIPTNNVMFTRMRRHRFEIEIEFPEIYE